MAFQFELIAIESDAVECIVYRRRVSYYILPLIIMKKEDGRRHDNTTSTQPSFLLPFLPSPWSSSFISRSRRSIRRTPRETGSSWQQGRFPMAAFFFKPSSSYMPSFLGGEAKQEKVMKRIKRCAVQLFSFSHSLPRPNLQLPTSSIFLHNRAQCRDTKVGRGALGSIGKGSVARWLHRKEEKKRRDSISSVSRRRPSQWNSMSSNRRVRPLLSLPRTNSWCDHHPISSFLWRRTNRLPLRQMMDCLLPISLSLIDL